MSKSMKIKHKKNQSNTITNCLKSVHNKVQDFNFKTKA